MLGLGQKSIRSFRFGSVRETCRHLLRCSRTSDGHFLPLTAAELVPKLQAEGFIVNLHDAEALLHELAAEGEALEMDSLAGYRWVDRAA